MCSVNIETNNLLAGRHLGWLTYEDYVDWAAGCLESGLDSKNIRILASLRKPLYSSEVEDYFTRSLHDLGWHLPDRQDCLMEYTRGLACEIVAGTLAPLEACRKIYRVVVSLQYPKELMPWVYLDEGLAPDTYSELSGAAWDTAIIQEAQRFISERSSFDLEDSSL
jgi:hypothetical protein